ncbi:DUF3800 domain-containing protein [Ligilactobacillus aviarius]|uniref:DUF3800 domain-containing protein n=4 Tax=Ligilactobacillus aviarius TaxID=1606 RepID=UPI0007DA0844|nr:DUF3800 domain-containing protein [Ligilactobacillus aviarius]OAQ03157.1 hypothetical protein A3O10_01195 [Ligilactobacillus aviarius]PEG70826.1 DUF3800 domain-containing protein [Ligilactobacillus aviarius]PEG74531.1 DUF3800 domain-containing protein [Ligilactobacillus aviarius]
MFYIDESGSITTNTYYKRRYFIISLIETNEPYHVKRIFKDSKKKLPIKFNHLFSTGDIKKEIKGSQMSVKVKRYIFNNLKNKTDVKFHYIVIDNHHLNDNFHNNVELCFNFVLTTYLKQLCQKRRMQNVKLYLDERNCSVHSLNSLQDYLRIELTLANDYADKVSDCTYCNSENEEIIQIADMLANLVYRACCNRNRKSDGNAHLLKELSPEQNMYFPYRYNDLPFFEKNIL